MTARRASRSLVAPKEGPSHRGESLADALVIGLPFDLHNPGLLEQAFARREAASNAQRARSGRA